MCVYGSPAVIHALPTCGRGMSSGGPHRCWLLLAAAAVAASSRARLIRLNFFFFLIFRRSCLTRQSSVVLLRRYEFARLALACDEPASQPASHRRRRSPVYIRTHTWTWVPGPGSVVGLGVAVGQVSNDKSRQAGLSPGPARWAMLSRFSPSPVPVGVQQAICARQTFQLAAETRAPRALAWLWRAQRGTCRRTEYVLAIVTQVGPITCATAAGTLVRTPQPHPTDLVWVISRPSRTRMRTQQLQL